MSEHRCLAPLSAVVTVCSCFSLVIGKTRADILSKARVPRRQGPAWREGQVGLAEEHLVYPFLPPVPSEQAQPCGH